jgi:colanic acid/amylovoran biosynthesis protein
LATKTLDIIFESPKLNLFTLSKHRGTSMKKILILDIGNGLNKGNLALLYSAIDTIKIYAPNVEFSLMYYGNDGSHSNLNIKEQHLVGKVYPKKPKDSMVSFLYLLQCTSVYALTKFGINASISKNSKLFSYYDNDIVVVIGGDTMSPNGKYETNTLTPFINILYAITLGKPTVLYGESLGYYTNHIIDSIAKFVLNKTSLILVRDKLSLEYLNGYRLNKPDIYFTADSAFLLPPCSISRICDIFSIEKINYLKKPLIGINTSNLINNQFNKNDRSANISSIDIMAKVIDHLIENLDANIIMVPHVYEAGNDDRVTASSIFKQIKNKSNIYMIKNEYSPQELKGIIGKCDLFIGGRMHSTIASTSMLVPTVGIAYSHKMYGIIGNMLGQEKYIVDVNELSYEKLISTIYDAWDNRSKIKKELESIIPVVKERAMLNGKYVSELLKN